LQAEGVSASDRGTVGEGAGGGAMKALSVSAISAESPDMDDEQFNDLVEDIRKNGQLVPIWKCGDEIIDGRKRSRACSILGIAVKAVDVSSDRNGHEISYSLNILRTHYTVTQRAMFASKRATLKKGDVKSQSVSEFGDRSIRQVAKEAGVQPSQISLAKLVRREGIPEVIGAVEAGAISLHAAEQIVDAPKNDQKQILEARLARNRDRSGRLIPTVRSFKASPKRAIEGRMQRCLDQLDNAVELAGTWLREDGATHHSDRAQWLKRLYSARTKISRILG